MRKCDLTKIMRNNTRVHRIKHWTLWVRAVVSNFLSTDKILKV